jgi:hypothetical protein
VKAYLFDLLFLNNGVIVTLFKYLKIAIMKDNQGEGNFVLLQIAIWKFETTLSLTWKDYFEQSIKDSQIGHS